MESTIYWCCNYVVRCWEHVFRRRKHFPWCRVDVIGSHSCFATDIFPLQYLFQVSSEIFANLKNSLVLRVHVDEVVACLGCIKRYVLWHVNYALFYLKLEICKVW